MEVKEAMIIAVHDNPFEQNPSNQNQRNNNFTRVDDDPFANDGKTIDISDDDLPF